MSRLIVALPAALAASFSLSSYRVQTPPTHTETPSETQQPLSTRAANKQDRTAATAAGTSATNTTTSATTRPTSTGGNGRSAGDAVHARRRRGYDVPKRFRLEDPDTVLDLERHARPPVGEASLRSGFGVELTNW